MEKNQQAFNIFLHAQNGDKLKQKELLRILSQDTLTIRYQYLSKAKSLGLGMKDLENLIFHALFKLFNRNNLEIDESTFLNYFRYIYMRIIQQELRSIYSKKEISFSDYEANKIKEEDNSNFSLFSDKLEFASPNKIDEKGFIESEICETLIYENKCLLDKIEQNILISYLKGYNILELAKDFNMPPSTMYSKFKNALNKIKKYVISNSIIDENEKFIA